jgi:hypothetical protein
MGDGKREGLWVVAEFDGNHAVLGLVANKGKKLTDEVRSQILGEKRTTFLVSYDFFAPLRPVRAGTGPNGEPLMGIARDPVVTGSHFVFSSCPVYVKMDLAKKVFFLDEMQEGDQRRYKGFIESAEESLIRQRAAELGLESGLQAGPPQRIPAGPGGIIDLSSLAQK